MAKTITIKLTKPEDRQVEVPVLTTAVKPVPTKATVNQKTSIPRKVQVEPRSVSSEIRPLERKPVPDDQMSFGFME